MPPLPTPFTDTGALDTAAIDVLVEALEPYVDGFLLLGSTGEAVYLDERERRALLEAARAAIPTSTPMLAGTGGEATRTVMARNREAAEIGADAALVIAPHYYKALMRHGILRDHYLRLADASPLPLYIYTFPGVTGFALSPELIGQLAQHENIHGLKYTSHDLMALTEIMRRVPEDFAVFTGNASTLLPALSLGAAGGILAVANIAAGLYRKILEHTERGELADARALQLGTNPLALAVGARHGIPGLKAAMRLQGLPAGYPREPLQDVTTDVEGELREILAGLGLS